MRTIVCLCLAATMLLAGCAHHQEPQEKPKYSAKDLDHMVTIRAALEKLQDLKQYGVDPDDAIRKNLLADAAKTTNGEVTTYEQIVAITGDQFKPPTPVEKVAGLFTFTMILWTMGGIFVGAAVIWLFGFHFLALMMLIPAKAWEVILWVAVVAMGYCVSFVDPDWQLAFLVPTALAFMGTVQFTCYLHGNGSKDYEIPATMLTVCWGALAICYGSHTIGFMATMSALTALGFVCGHMPGLVYVGYDKEAAVPRGTLAGFCMLSLHVGMTMCGINNQYVSVFREGMNFMGAFAFYLGMLIMASKWYWYERVEVAPKDGKAGFVEYRWVTDWKMYFVFQGLTLTAGLLALFIGSVFGMSALMGIGGTVFCLFILEKYYEIPWKGQGWAWSLLGLGLILYGMGSFIKTYPQYFLFGG